jgi:hypothetical protein
VDYIVRAQKTLKEITHIILLDLSWSIFNVFISPTMLKLYMKYQFTSSTIFVLPLAKLKVKDLLGQHRPLFQFYI